MASANETERLGKIKTKTEINKLTSEIRDSGKDDSLKAEIHKLTVKVNELASVKTEIQELKKQITEGHRLNPQRYGNSEQSRDFSSKQQNHDMPNPDYPRRNFSRQRNFYRCKNCEIGNKSFCNHCFNCGSDSHRRNKCEQKN